jgi:hypothetical protein
MNRRPVKPMFSLKRKFAKAGAVAMGATNTHAWATLAELLGQSMPPSVLLAHVRDLRREEMLFKLARFAAILANSRGSVLGAEARAWTRDLLMERRDSSHPLEAAVARALEKLSVDRAVGHAHVVYLLQLLAVAYGSPTGPTPHDGFLAFLMLAANDHIPEWTPDKGAALSNIENVLGPVFFCSSFNRSDDPMRTLLRIVDIAGHRSERHFPDPQLWERVQREAFGTSFEEYVELFLAPMLLISKGWGLERPPAMLHEQWRGRDDRERALYERWLAEASLTLDAATLAFASRTMPSGLPGLPQEFFRRPFVKIGSHILCLSPWHIRDHAVLGTWAKLNAASKRVLDTSSNQVFSSAFGDSFEHWCASLAEEAAGAPTFRDAVILPSAPGAEDEIEDVVMRDGKYVAMFSAKASPVPEASLKTAEHVRDVIAWLQRFFFEGQDGARARGYRGGAALLLDRKIQRLRAGDYEARGLRKNAIVLPCIISFDNVGESGILYKWLDQECRRLGILVGRPNVRPLTIITPEDYEALIALGVEGRGVCRLLAEKTGPRFALEPLDQFLYDRASGAKLMRLPSMKERFQRLAFRSVERMGEALEALKAAQAAGAAEPGGESGPATGSAGQTGG